MSTSISIKFSFQNSFLNHLLLGSFTEHRNFRSVSEIPILFRCAALGRDLVLHRNFRLCIGTSDECRKSLVISDKILSAENKSSVGTSGGVSELPIPIGSPVLPLSKYSRENLFGLIGSSDRRSELPIHT